MGKLSKADKKIAYDGKLCQLLDEYTQILLVAADNVGSTQLQNIRKGLRGDSVVLMGKNTMMKRSIRIHSDKTGNTAFLSLIPLLVVRKSLCPFFIFLVEKRNVFTSKVCFCIRATWG
jgi:large subunit ribosomal protein LP0